ncbi:tRNA (adenosine(37)-N6)-threonylcarbamoyltransferase complex dimerization subunit type 1 TsaB [Palleronia sp. LCG004]|uniref:tRNA (adenosine(37)-N6)-threonylcarbamoyltransferase complex dimerization subunit type 1 TsaB n=1 Tax=Palleronia sp. LCG004 TaxID=3079304 RepID=UPI0029436F93|nr:tRNA (adenosine(37)-N6)-threonylcarbamoyltransferase complex dimerization subunit type 1 TsaB [Palleronia sp. LCG004]WOI56930.1 tRNA (adenosine(37)-N6)-threonylcarbamoyltransferase complex dimerization subunit type 1 TsaB [Palleronia sp. LCG004]
MPETRILVFDTSAAHCAAALLSGDRILGERREEMARGQAERLMPLIEEIMQGADLAFADLDAIAVGVGPGNFTGIRIAVAAARGLAMGLGRPAIGVDTFHACLPPEAETGEATVLLGAPRGQIHVQRFGNGLATGDATICDADAVETAGRVIADDLAAGIVAGADRADPWPERLRRMARRAEAILASGQDIAPPAPLYIREADAAPARPVPPVR